MKITAIRPYPVWIGARNQLIVKVETDEGVFGYGMRGSQASEQVFAKPELTIRGSTASVRSAK